MPTDPSRATHDSGASSLGQPVQPSSRLPAHQQPQQQPPAHIQYPVQQPRPHHQQHLPPHPQPVPNLQQNRQHINGPHHHYGPMSTPHSIPQQLSAQQPNPAAGAPPPPPAHGRPMPQHSYFSYVGELMPPQQFNFYPSQPYFQVPPTRNPQPQQPMSNQQPRQFQQPVTGMMPQRQPASRVSVPKPKKKLLSIVDPETQQEIKVSKATPTHPPSKPSSSAPSVAKPKPVPINPPSSRPLSLVADPADAPTSSSSTPKPAADKPVEKAPTPALPSSEKSQTENFKPQPKINLKDSSAAVAESRTIQPAVSSSNTKRADVIGDTPVARDAISNGSQGPEEPEGASVVATADTISNDEVVDTNDVPDIVAKAEDNLDGMTSDVSSSTFADIRSDSTDLLPSHSSAKSDGHTAESAPVARQASSTTETPRPADASASTSTGVSSKPVEASPLPNGAGVAPPVESDAVEPVPATVADKKLSVQPSADTQDSDRLTADTAENTSKEEVDPAPDTSAPKEEDAPVPEANDAGPVFKPGDRRVYAPAFMHSMRTALNAKKVAEYISALTQSDIMRGDASGMKRNDSRGNPRTGGRAMRTGSGPLSSDPRGSRAAFANQPASGYVMPTFHSSSQVPAGGSGNYDLRSARLQAPPAPRAPPGNRSGDPRGSRSMRMDGPTRGHGQGPIDPFVQARPPVEKLQRSEKGWKRNKDADDDITKRVKQVRSLLNKLTIEKFEKIFGQIIAIDLSDSETLVGVVQEIFEKTLFEPKFSDMYAELCRRLDEVVQDKNGSQKDEAGKQLQFRRILLNNCKDEFTRFANSGKGDEKDAKATEVSEEKPDAEEAPKKTPAEERAEKEARELKARKAKQRMLANVRFIGELYLKDLLKETIIHRQCIQKLLHQGAGTRDEDVLEAVCKLISKTGEKLSNNVDATKHMEGYFRVLVQIGHDPKLPPRVRFMIQDLEEQRGNKWKVRREEAGAKTIAEIHQEAAQEEKAKTDAANALRERKSRGGSAGGQRGGRSYQGRSVALTMASVSKAPSGSKNTMLERQLSRSSANSLNGPIQMSGMRLGPPGSKSGGAPGGGGGMALRPNGSRSGSSGSRFSALGSADGGGLVSSGSGDARRGKLSKSPPISRRPMSASSSKSEESSGDSVAVMDMETAKRKTRGLLQEYSSNKNVNEVFECLKLEFTAVNYASFAIESLKVSIDSNPQEAAIYGSVLGVIVSNNIVEPKLFLDAFEKIGPTVPDFSMDSPLAPELFCQIVASVSAVDKFKACEGSGDGGVGFMKAIVSGMEDKRTACKMVVLLCARRYEMLKGKMSDAERQRAIVTGVYDCIGVDLAADMVAWDSMMGPKMLKTILERANMTFLISTFEYELRLREMLLEDGGKDVTSEQIVNAVKGHGTDVKLMKMVVRVSLDWVFDESRDAEKIAEDYKQIIGAAVKTLGMTSKDAQIGALCATQKYFFQNESQVCKSLGNGEERNGSKVFRMLYDSDIVRREYMMAWKEDMDVSAKIEGKEKMLFETSTFFTWLNQNQSDDA